MPSSVSPDSASPASVSPAAISRQYGRYQVDAVSAGTFALDGGAMFGIIPKPLWEKLMPADEKNRILMGTNCLLLRDGVRTILVDNGMGDKWNDKFRDMYKVTSGPLAKNLQNLGVAVDDITDVILTHLHFDHAGGTTFLDEKSGNLAFTFRNAKIHVGRNNWEWAQHPNERDRGSYRDENWLPLEKEPDRLVLHDDTVGRICQIYPELDALICDGHTTGQVLPRVGDAKGQRILFGADMIPTRAHVKMAWIMGYDLRPIELLAEKRKILSMCTDENVLLHLEHEPAVEKCTVQIVRKDDDFTYTPAHTHSS